MRGISRARIEERKRVFNAARTASLLRMPSLFALSRNAATVSEAIRTPMSAILGFADLLEESMTCCTVCSAWTKCEERSRNRQHVHTIKRNGHFLLEILNDILDLSKIEAGKLMAEAEAAKVTDVEKQRVALFRKAIWDYMVEGRKKYFAKQEKKP